MMITKNECKSQKGDYKDGRCFASSEKEWILVNRLHVNGRNRQNDWGMLNRYLGLQLKDIEDTKAVALINKNKKDYIKKRLESYNRINHTDFFI